MERVITYGLNENFIQNLTEYIDQNYIKEGEDSSRLAFVFGGKRPALFLKKSLSRKIKKSFFPPRFFTVDDFVEYILAKKGPFTKISDLEACFVIYQLTRDIAPDILKGRDSFSRFLPWAREIIYFIEQLDLEDIRLEALKNIQEKAAIGYDVPENINSLLKSIVDIRQAYHARLKQKNSYCRGFMYLAASQYIREADFSEFEKMHFCGLFYLHKTEESIIKNLFDRQKALLFFQGGSREWSVLARVARELDVTIKPKQDKPPGYTLSIKCGFDAHSEVCLAREALKGLKKLDNTVIVLPNPDNIIPLLLEISAVAEDFNVSLGYPLKRSSLYSLFECLFKAQESRKDGGEYYSKDYLAALSHPLIKNLKLLANPSITRVLVHKIEEILIGIEKTPLGGSLFFKLSDILESRDLYDLAQATMKKMDIEVGYSGLKDAVGRLHDLLFSFWGSLKNFSEFSLCLERFIDALVEKGFLSDYPLNLKMAQKILAIKEELKNSSFSRESFTLQEMFKIFKNKIEAEVVPFSGSPLKGLQILGLFETRSLNFENVIILDVNESVLPNLKIYEPLIPREVMIGLGLNRLEKEEEIQRYQFKRLLAGAKNVNLTYIDRDDTEKSRFIEELIWERQRQENSFEVLDIPQASFTVKVLPKKLEIKKKAEIIDYLRDWEYSASSVNTYLHCPLRFYYQYVLGLREKEDLLGEPEGKDIGTFIHELLCQTFSRFVGKRPRIDSQFKGYFFECLDKNFARDFERKMKSDAFLIKEIINFRMGKFLDNEINRDVQELLCLEKTLKAKIKFGSGSFKFKAIIDRIDRVDEDNILILDYKTGGGDILPETNVQGIESAGFKREALKNTIRSFQLPLYLYLVDNDKQYQGRHTNACLYFIKDINSKTLGLSKLFRKEEQLIRKDEIMGVYLKALEAVLGDILNPGIPFKADEEDARQCENCPFFYLCR